MKKFQRIKEKLKIQDEFKGIQRMKQNSKWFKGTQENSKQCKELTKIQQYSRWIHFYLIETIETIKQIQG